MTCTHCMTIGRLHCVKRRSAIGYESPTDRPRSTRLTGEASLWGRSVAGRRSRGASLQPSQPSRGAKLYQSLRDVGHTLCPTTIVKEVRPDRFGALRPKPDALRPIHRLTGWVQLCEQIQHCLLELVEVDARSQLFKAGCE